MISNQQIDKHEWEVFEGWTLPGKRVVYKLNWQVFALVGEF